MYTILTTTRVFKSFYKVESIFAYFNLFLFVLIGAIAENVNSPIRSNDSENCLRMDIENGIKYHMIFSHGTQFCRLRISSETESNSRYKKISKSILAELDNIPSKTIKQVYRKYCCV